MDRPNIVSTRLFRVSRMPPLGFGSILTQQSDRTSSPRRPAAAESGMITPHFSRLGLQLLNPALAHDIADSFRFGGHGLVQKTDGFFQPLHAALDRDRKQVANVFIGVS
jgi:hypothetical protein